MIALITAACLLGDSMLYIVLPLYWQDVGLLALLEVGILLSVNRLVRLPLNPLATWLFHKIGLRSGILIAVVLAGATTFGYGQLHGFWIWLVLRCIWGISWTLLRLGAFFTIIEISEDHNRGYYMGLYNGLFRIGSLVGMLVGGLLTEMFNITVAAIVFSVVAFIAVPFVLRFVSANRIEVVPRDQSTLKAFISSFHSDRRLIYTLLAGLLIAMIYQGMFTSTISYLVHLHISDSYYLWGIPIGAAVIAGMLQALRWGWEPWLAPWIGRKSDVRNRRLPFFIGSLIAASVLFFLVLVQMPTTWWLFILIGIQLTATLLTTLMDSLASDVAARSLKVLKMAMYSFAVDLGAAIGPFLGYLLVERSLYSGAALILFGLALSWGLGRNGLYNTNKGNLKA